MDLMHRHLSLRALSVTFVLIITACVPSFGAVEPESFEALRSMGKAFASVAEQASPAVVSIVCEKEAESGDNRPFNIPNGHPFFDDEMFERFFGGPRGRNRDRAPRAERAQGTGFIISPDGYVLTNNHLIGNAKDDTIEVTLSNGKELKGKVVGTDPASDVAVAKLDGDEDFPFVKLADSDRLEVGEWVVAIGNPFGLSHTVTAGIVSAKGRNRLALGGEIAFQDFIQTDAAINLGNSGGPLLNLEGEVVGINTAIAGPSGANAGIGFAIPINMAQGISDQLIATGTVKRGFLGIQMAVLTEELADSLDMEDTLGALVEAVGKDTPAEKAGLKRYDVIVELDGDPIDSMQRLRQRVAMLPPETRVKLKIIRDGRQKTLTAVLGERSDSALARLGGQSVTLKNMGLEVANISPEMRENLGIEDLQGVLVISVDSRSEAADKELQPGMVIMEVNRKPVKNVKELNQAVEETVEKGKETILLIVTDGTRERMVALKLPEE